MMKHTTTASIAALLATLTLTGCTTAGGPLDIFTGAAKQNARDEWQANVDKTATMPADQAWTFLQKKAADAKSMGILLSILGLEEFDSSATAEKGFDDLRNKANAKKLSRRAAEAIAHGIETALVDTMVKATGENSTERLPLFMGTFVVTPSAREQELQLPADSLNRELQYAMQHDPAFIKRFMVATSNYNTAQQLLDAANGSDFRSRFPSAEPNPLPFDPALVTVLTGSWDWTIGPRTDGSLTPLLTVTAYADVQNVQKRQFLANERFSQNFVFHPKLGWIGEEYDASLAATAAATTTK